MLFDREIKREMDRMDQRMRIRSGIDEIDRELCGLEEYRREVTEYGAEAFASGDESAVDQYADILSSIETGSAQLKRLRNDLMTNQISGDIYAVMGNIVDTFSRVERAAPSALLGKKMKRQRGVLLRNSLRRHAAMREMGKTVKSASAVTTDMLSSEGQRAEARRVFISRAKEKCGTVDILTDGEDYCTDAKRETV